MIRSLTTLCPFRYVFGLAILFLVGLTSVGAQETGSRSNNDPTYTREIADFLKQWNAAIATKDIAAVRSAYSTDSSFRWFEDGVLTYRSAEEIVKRVSLFPVNTKIETELGEIDIHLLSDKLAYCSASYKTKLTFPSNTVEFAGVFTALLERKSVSWRFVSGHTSTIPRTPARTE